jgi:hypothetical protein
MLPHMDAGFFTTLFTIHDSLANKQEVIFAGLATGNDCDKTNFVTVPQNFVVCDEFTGAGWQHRLGLDAQLD